MYEELIKRLREAPSAWRDAELHYKASDAIEELTRENESLAKSVNEASEILRKRWISVTERLPEDGQWVLVWESGRFAYVDKMHNGKWMIADSNYAIIYYWMPLPEPPKEET